MSHTTSIRSIRNRLFLLLLRVTNSPFGRVLQAIRENDFRAEAIGYRTVVYRTLTAKLQFEVARRGEVARCGVRLPGHKLTAQRLRSALAETLTMTAGAKRVAAGSGSNDFDASVL